MLKRFLGLFNFNYARTSEASERLRDIIYFRSPECTNTTIQVITSNLQSISTNKHYYSSYQLHVSVNAQISLYWPLSIDIYSLFKILI